MYITSSELLNDPRVIDEINIFRKSRAEKTGEVVDFRDAASEWFMVYSADWVKKNMYMRKKLKTRSRFADRHFIFKREKKG